MKRRQSGVLMPIYSLPGKYGCGTLGKEALKFIDWLKAGRQSIWQILPVGPTSIGDSPYSAVSSFAGNPYFIDLELLEQDGLLKKTEYENVDFGSNPSKIDYEKLLNNKIPVLHIAYERGKNLPDFQQFKETEKAWLQDYSMYIAAKKHFDNKNWTQWTDEGLKKHWDSSVEQYKTVLAEEMDFQAFMQFEFFKQWQKMKAYANEQGISLLGDIPVYVPLDSADVWASPKTFKLDDNYMPKEVSGVPPDYFNSEGQLWGNPIYDWDALKNDGYGWWLRRIDGSLRFVDLLRIDHFRGFDQYWAVPYGETTAKNGVWRQGPGIHFVNAFTSWFGKERFIVEDLGVLTDSVRRLLEESRLPGMKVLEFAFDAGGTSIYLPHTYTENCICYVGTHDNTTVMAWPEESRKEDVAFAKKYLNLTEEEGLNWGFIRGGMCSAAYLFITQVQDYLGLGAEARTNVPGVPDGNWRWRLTEGQLTEKISSRLADVTRMYGRG